MYIVATAKTFKNDLYLPTLPYTKADASLRMYMDSLNAILPIHIFMKYKDEIENLINGDADLLDYSRNRISGNLKNWIENWWLKWYHLSSETELIPYCSISGFSTLHKSIWPEDNESQINRGAEYLYALLIYWECLRQEIIAPERSKKGEMLSMSMYRNIFNCSRMPTSSSDKILRYFRTACEGFCPNHISLCIKGHVFKVDFIEKEIIWPLDKIKEIIHNLFKLVDKKDTIPNVTMITSLPKREMVSSMTFAHGSDSFIENIQQSILWFSFDESKPSLEHMLMSVMGSDCQNRCGIKSLSVTVFANGLIGLNADSAVLDPDVFIKVIQFADMHISKKRSLEDYPIPFKYLSNMQLSANMYMKYKMDFSSSANNELIHIGRLFNMKVFQMDCGYRCFKWFNLKIAKSLNLDPSITIHLLILLTYWDIHKAITSACAIISQRKYYRGRHDIVPTVTVDTVNWIKAVHDKNCSPNKLKLLFWLAHKKLQTIFRFCENNCGPVLHLNYLNSLFRDTSKQLKDVCDDNFWYRTGYSGHFGIRTIYLGEVHVVAIIPDVPRFGYSISYSIDEESTVVSVIHRCSEEQLNPRLPKIFLKEFLTSIELLNQMFIK